MSFLDLFGKEMEDNPTKDQRNLVLNHNFLSYISVFHSLLVKSVTCLGRI